MRLKEIKQKIGLTENISNITRALEMVSAAKIKKAQRIVRNIRPFAEKIIEILKRLGESQKEFFSRSTHYFYQRKIKKILLVVVASDRGFCGAFNKEIVKFAQKEVEKLNVQGEVEIFAVGKKAIKFFKKQNYKIKAEFIGIGDYGEFDEVKPIAQTLLSYYNNDEFQKIYFIFTDFVSSFVQKPRIIQLLPIDYRTLNKLLQESSLSQWYQEKDISPAGREDKYEYIFEPSVEKVFNNIIPHLIEFQVYYTILESNASEHAARMMAMRNANKNADEMIQNLTLKYHKARQEQITSEISEITSAKEVVK